MIGEAELKARVRQCARLFAAWPNARPASIDMTLLEYVNATRGIDLESLRVVVDAAIAAGGEFLPPAGAILERIATSRIRAAGQVYNAHLSGEQRAREQIEALLSQERAELRRVEPLCIEAVGDARLKLGAPPPLRLGDGR